MRTLQLVMLALLATAARADLIVQFSGSITGRITGRYRDVNLPSAITFNVPYDMSAMMSDTVGAGAGEDENSNFSSLAINGFGVFGPTCDSYSAIFGSDYDPACGPPMDVSVHTRSGFLYGGHVPEPSSLLLLGCLRSGEPPSLAFRTPSPTTNRPPERKRTAKRPRIWTLHATGRYSE